MAPGEHSGLARSVVTHRPAPPTSATSCWSGHPARARPPCSRRCSPPPAPSPAPGRTTEGTTVSDFDEAEMRQQRSVGLSLAPVTRRRGQGQLPGHARVRRLRRRPAGRAAGRGRRAVRDLGGRRRRRRHADALGGVRGGRDASRGRRHPAGPPARRLRRAGRRPARAPSARACCRWICRCRRDDGEPTGFIDLIGERIHDYSVGHRGSTATPDAERPGADRGQRAARSSRGSSPRARTRP